MLGVPSAVWAVGATGMGDWQSHAALLVLARRWKRGYEWDWVGWGGVGGAGDGEVRRVQVKMLGYDEVGWGIAD